MTDKKIIKTLPLFIALLFFGFLATGQTVYSRSNARLTGESSSVLKPPLQLKWSFATGDEVKSSPVIAGDRIFVGSTDGYLYALSTTGKLLWKYNAATAIEASPVVVDNVVYFGTLGGKLLGLDVANGSVKMSAEADGQIIGGSNYMKMTDGKRVLLTGSYDNYLYANDVTTGKVLWKYQTENYINGTPAIYNNSAVVFGGCDGILHVVNTSNGKSVADIDLKVYLAASPAIGGQNAYVGDYDGHFKCVNLATKKIVWQYKTDNETGLPFLSSPAIRGGKVVVGCQDRKVYCFDADSGKILWSTLTKGKVDASPLLTQQYVVTGSDDGRLYFLRLTDGGVVWSYEIGSAISGTAGLSNTLVVVGAKDGRIYALGK